MKHNLHLMNVMALDLNFLLYVNNVYTSVCTDKITFPGRPFEPAGMLSYSEFQEIMPAIWNDRLTGYNKPLIGEQVIEQMHKLPEYRQLFLRNSTGEQLLTELWEAFNLWWWPDYGIHSFMDRTSDPIIIKLAELLERQANQKDWCIPAEQLRLIVVFEQPPNPCVRQHSHLYVAYLSELLNPNKLEGIAADMHRNHRNLSLG